ncbi:MAG: hypothetical protein RL448_640 [Actinomycetota bacterium]|jgi:hypothetical protein
MAEKKEPTRKRKEAEAANRKSLLAPARNKEEKRAQKEAIRRSRADARAAFMRGDEAALPLRDRGPARRFVRNYVDARRSVGELFLPLVFIVFLLSLIRNQTIALASIALMYATIVAAIMDGIIMSRRLKREIEKRFPGTTTRGLGRYAWSRSILMRRTRTPRPQVKIGEKI